MKQTMQQTALQRALQPVARTIKTGLAQFDIADTEENIQEQADDRAESFKRWEDRESRRKAKLQTIVEDELAEPGQIDAMMSSSSAPAITPILQAYAEQATHHLRGALGPKGKKQRGVKRLQHRQKHHRQEHHQ